jgi:hypothetical protein
MHTGGGVWKKPQQPLNSRLKSGFRKQIRGEVAEVGIVSNLNLGILQKSEYFDFTAAISEAVICSWEIWVMNSG